MPETQKALLLEKKFGYFVVGDTEKYKPGPGEILIKVHSVALNPAHWKIQKSGLSIEEYPAILGIDIAGEVVELGTGVTEHKLGDRVFCQSQWEKNREGFQQYVVSLAVTAAKIPPNISYDEAATDFTAQVSGQLTIQLAHLSGFSLIITTTSLKHTDFLKSLGATRALDRHLPLDALRVEVDKATGGKPVNIVYDAVVLDATQKLGLELLTSVWNARDYYPSRT
ncbi:hypothetical protein NLJ89_g6436 [Agrocybe chaxingu]|uniref:Enoyl reductase (ER) domain-containing protein n=1 Tax=Agrocybe chaxingu TaxID=84603 RepID=A0A9W8JZ54_9AGAR|nr:hypothetical protein NLJ89_g6436 [Agrocybe chaxingu]